MTPRFVSVKRSEPARLGRGKKLPQSSGSGGLGGEQEKDRHDSAEQRDAGQELNAPPGERVRRQVREAAPPLFPFAGADSGSSTIHRTDFEQGQTPPTRFKVGIRRLACSGAIVPAATSRSVET